MLRVFYGENRIAAEAEIKQILGEGYEVFEGGSLTVGDLPSVFQGASLFGIMEGGGEGESRRILLKNLTENGEVWGKIADYVGTGHEVVIWEPKVDKRSSEYKKLKELGVEMREFPALRKPEANLVFGILDLALKDGVRAVKEVEKIEIGQDPYMFLGLLVTQALKKFELRNGAKERRILKMLAELDIQMKTTVMEPWMLVKGFLLRVGEVVS